MTESNPSSLDGMIERMELEAFEAFVSSPPFEYSTERRSNLSAWPGNYKSPATNLAWAAWQARAALASKCRGVAHQGCNYLAPCGYFCDKCGAKT